MFSWNSRERNFPISWYRRSTYETSVSSASRKSSRMDNGRFMHATSACGRLRISRLLPSCERPSAYGPLRPRCCVGMRPFDQSHRQAQFCAQRTLAGLHFAVVDFVVVTRQVQHAVQDEDLHFRGQRVPNFGGIGIGDFQRDGDVTSNARQP